MEIKKETVTTFTYSLKDIKELILTDLVSKGYIIGNSSFSDIYKTQKEFDYIDGQYDVYKNVDVFDGFYVKLKE